MPDFKYIQQMFCRLCYPTGFKVRDFESRLELSFQPCIEAARNIVFKTTYAVLIAITAMIVIHVFGWVASRCLRLKQRTPVRRIYVTSVPGGQQHSDVHPSERRQRLRQRRQRNRNHATHDGNEYHDLQGPDGHDGGSNIPRLTYETGDWNAFLSFAFYFTGAILRAE